MKWRSRLTCGAVFMLFQLMISIYSSSGLVADEIADGPKLSNHRESLLENSTKMLWEGLLPIADELEISMFISATNLGCIEFGVYQTDPPVFIRSYLHHAATTSSNFTYSKSLDFMTDDSRPEFVSIPEDGEYVLQVHGLFELRQGWAPQGAIRHVLDRVFEIPLNLNRTSTASTACSGIAYWWNGEWCPSLCQGRAAALLADAALGFRAAEPWRSAAAALDAGRSDAHMRNEARRLPNIFKSRVLYAAKWIFKGLSFESFDTARAGPTCSPRAWGGSCWSGRAACAPSSTRSSSCSASKTRSRTCGTRCGHARKIDKHNHKDRQARTHARKRARDQHRGRGR
jgi:hypothetical protein